MSDEEYKVAWRPIPNSSQELALDSRCNVTLYSGTRGPGKTDTQLMKFKRRVGIGYGPFWRGVIFDRAYKNLDDLVAKSKRWFNAFGDGAKFNFSKSDYKWSWPTGEELLFRVLKEPKDYWNYHGQEFPFIGWNELTKYPTSELYDLMFSCNRSSFVPEINCPGLPEIPLEVFATCNPYGAGHNWVKDEFIDAAAFGKIVTKEIEVFDPRTQRDIIVKRTQVSLFGSYRENIYLNAQYIAGMHEIKDDNIKKAWLDGDWNIVVGGAFNDLWKEQVHVIPRVPIPDGWRIDRAFDWGSTHPFSVGWFAKATGEELYPGFAPPRGSIIQIHEYYGTAKIGSNKGLQLGPTVIAKKIIEKEIELMQGWISTQPLAGPADNQIGNKITDEDTTIESKMSKCGIKWTKSDKSPGSRKNGLEVFRDMLNGSLVGDYPGFYVMEHCIATRKIIPNLQRDDEDLDDIDTTCEDHPWDMIRYRILKEGLTPLKKLNIHIT